MNVSIQDNMDWVINHNTSNQYNSKVGWLIYVKQYFNIDWLYHADRVG